MANEITPTSIADLVTSQVLAAEYLMLLTDRDGSLLTHPALMYATATAPNSTVVRVPHVGLGGYDLLTAHTPGSEVANTALTDGKTDVTIAPRAKRYNVDDFAKYLAAGKLGPAMMAMDLVLTVAQTLISLIANVGDDFTTTAGVTNTVLTWATILSAKGSLASGDASGQIVCVVSKVQWSHLEQDALSQGAVPAETNAGVVNQGLEAYKGRWYGIDFFVSKHVPTANAGVDHAGCMFVRGAIAWADAPMDDEGDPNIGVFGRARLERARQGTHLSTSWVFSHVSGVSKAIDAAGVTIISRATL